MTVTAVPTIAEIKKHFNVDKLPNNALFWSSCGTGTGETWQTISNAYAKTAKRLTLDLMWKDNWYKQYINPKTHTEAEIRAFWNQASEAMATISSGVPYVLLPPTDGPTVWSKCSTWDKVEYPALIKKSNVNKICRVNYDSKTGKYSNPFAVWPKVDKYKC